MIAPRDLIIGGVRLFSLPQVCIRLNELVDDINHSSNDVAAVISQDAGLTARLLRIVNSPFYGFTSKVATVSRAITLLGSRDLRDLAFATSAVRMFHAIPNNLADMTSFWRHSIYCSVVARLIAGRCNVLHKERLFVAGLLHDIGQLVIINKLPELARAALRRSADGSVPLHQAEQDVIGFDHANVGAELLSSWNLPITTVEAVALHHDPDRLSHGHLDAGILHVANALTDIAETGCELDAVAELLDPAAWRLVGLDINELELVMEEARPQFIAALSLFFPGEASQVAP